MRVFIEIDSSDFDSVKVFPQASKLVGRDRFASLAGLMKVRNVFAEKSNSSVRVESKKAVDLFVRIASSERRKEAFRFDKAKQTNERVIVRSTQDPVFIVKNRTNIAIDSKRQSRAFVKKSSDLIFSVASKRFPRFAKATVGSS